MAEIRCAIEIRQDDEQAGPGRLYGTLMRYGSLPATGRNGSPLGRWSGPTGASW